MDISSFKGEFMSKLSLSAATIAFVMASTSNAQQIDPSQTCKEEQQALEGLAEKYKPEQERLKAEGDDIRDEAPANLRISGEIVFEDAHVGFDVPQVTMTQRQISFDVPQVTMKQRNISFDIFEPGMERQKIGEKPSMTCRNNPYFPYQPRCTTTWEPIYADVPVLSKKTVRISTDIPEVRMDRTDMALSIPAVSMNRIDLYYKLPRVTVANPIPDSGPVEEKGKALEQKANALANRINEDAAQGTNALYRCHTDQLVLQRQEVVMQFDSALDQLSSAITSVTRMGANPESFTTESGTVNLVRQFEDLKKQRAAAIEKIDAAIAQMRTDGQSELRKASAYSEI
jgi:hypothetical protein